MRRVGERAEARWRIVKRRGKHERCMVRSVLDAIANALRLHESSMIHEIERYSMPLYIRMDGLPST